MRLSRAFAALLLLAVPVAACQPAAEPPPLPTLVVLDETPPTPTQESAPAAVEAVAQASATFTPLPPTVEAPPTPTLPIVRLSTVTPAPDEAAARPQAVADLVITESQFQAEVDRRVPSIDSIQRVRIDFTPQGITAELTALGGAAFITGNVQVDIQVQGGFAVITIGDITVNAPEPPETYVEVASREFFSLLIDVLDTLLNSRMGSQFNLQDLTLTDDSILVSLLVPVE